MKYAIFLSLFIVLPVLAVRDKSEVKIAKLSHIYSLVENSLTNFIDELLLYKNAKILKNFGLTASDYQELKKQLKPEIKKGFLKYVSKQISNQELDDLEFFYKSPLGQKHILVFNKKIKDFVNRFWTLTYNLKIIFDKYDYKKKINYKNLIFDLDKIEKSQLQRKYNKIKKSKLNKIVEFFNDYKKRSEPILSGIKQDISKNNVMQKTANIYLNEIRDFLIYYFDNFSEAELDRLFKFCSDHPQVYKKINRELKILLKNNRW